MSQRKATIVKDFLWACTAAGFVAIILRFAYGLGATTGLSDTTPWGFWIGFDLLGGVALAAGGFTIAATVYIFHRELYRPLLRSAILTAFLGYLSVIFALLCDLGLPWHIWKPIVNWQPHSVMFEVAWCVMLYTTVLFLEFAPTVLEHPWFRLPIFRAVLTLLKRLTLPLVILGIALSTLHQSSLGSLFLIMPYRLHPLWYSPIQPILFFVSAVALGLLTVTLEAFVSAYLYDHELPHGLLAGLGKVAAGVLWVYLALRVGDLALRGLILAPFDGSWQGVLFLIELGLGALIPAILLSIPRVRRSPIGLGTSAILGVSGIILNRLSVSVIAQYRPPETAYFPSLSELLISLGVLSAIGLVFLFIVETFNVFGAPEKHELDQSVSSPVSYAFQDDLWRNHILRRSFVVLLVIAATFALLPSQIVEGRMMPSTEVRSAVGGDILWIDGNRSEEGVRFEHQKHIERQRQQATKEETACAVCHHLSKPGDQATPCWECHRDMYLPTSIFDHTFHQQVLGGNVSCSECHIGEHIADSAVGCNECHETMASKESSTVKFNYAAQGYVDALHDQCIACHEREKVARNKEDLPRCPTCHRAEGAPPGVRRLLSLSKP